MCCGTCEDKALLSLTSSGADVPGAGEPSFDIAANAPGPNALRCPQSAAAGGPDVAGAAGLPSERPTSW